LRSTQPTWKHAITVSRPSCILIGTSVVRTTTADWRCSWRRMAMRRNHRSSPVAQFHTTARAPGAVATTFSARGEAIPSTTSHHAPVVARGRHSPRAHPARFDADIVEGAEGTEDTEDTEDTTDR